MQRTLVILALALFVPTGCFLAGNDSGYVTDPSGSRFMDDGPSTTVDESVPDGKLSSGENIKAAFPRWGFKSDYCSGALLITTEVCLFEQGDLVPSKDGNGKFICGKWKHRIACSGGEYDHQSSTCVSRDAHCDMTLMGTPPRPCGWRMTTLIVEDVATGEIVEEWDEAAVDKLLYEMLPPASS